jgi:hypothetical protein
MPKRILFIARPFPLTHFTFGSKFHDILISGQMSGFAYHLIL